MSWPNTRKYEANPSMTNQTNTNGGASVGGDVNPQGDFVCRDQTIHNIVIVGRLLEFAQVEGLFPQIKDNDFSSIAEAIEGALNNRLEGDLADAVAFAGEILSEFIKESIVTYTGKPIPLAELVSNLIDHVGHKLKENGYWEAYSETMNIPEYSRGILLEVVTMLYRKNFGNAVLHFGIASTNHVNSKGNFIHFHFVMATTIFTGFQYRIIYPEGYNAKVLRIFIAGIVLDLIRLYSDNIISAQLLRELSDFLKPSK